MLMMNVIPELYYFQGPVLDAVELCIKIVFMNVFLYVFWFMKYINNIWMG